MTKKIDKVSRYEWSAPGNVGAFRWIPVEVLKIPECQREQISEANTLAVAGKFSWSNFGCATVQERDGGELMVVDGQQRLLAAMGATA